MAAPLWQRVWPAPLAIDGRERLRVVLGAALGLLLTAWLSQALASAWAVPGWPWLVAPMGATAVLVFVVPSSPMAQPWAAVVGNTVSAAVGIACVRWLGPPALAASVAVAGAIALMFALRCLHPPGGACALLTALGGVADPRFVLFPVLVNSLLLVGIAWAYHRLTRRTPVTPPAPVVQRDDEAAALSADLDAVLARYNRVLDIRREDLEALLHDTGLRAYQRKLADTRCSDIMSKPPITVGIGTTLDEATALFGKRRIKALPVVDAGGAVVGILTPADLLRAPPGTASVGAVMTRRVRVANSDRHLSELIPLFAGSGHHHLPIVDAGGCLVGVLTQSDVVAALCRLDAPAV